MSRRPITAEDLLAIKVVGDPQLSPDGARVAFTVKTTDAAKNKYRSHLWLVGTSDGSEARQFTAGEVGDSAPRWSPDGRLLAFVRIKDKETQLWRIPADGGEARALTRLPEGTIGAPVWSPDSKRLAFSFRATHADFTEKVRKQREESGRSTPARQITRLHYREDGFGWLDCRQHVWLCEATTGEAAQLTDGPEDDNDPAWSPDGRQLVFASNRSADPAERPFGVDLWLVSADPAALPVSTFERLPTPTGFKGGCAWSPNGAWIAYTGVETEEDRWIPKHNRVWVVSSSGGSPARCLTSGLDRGIGMVALSDVQAGSGLDQPRWTVDSASLLFVVGDRGNAAVYSAGLAGDEPVALTSGTHVVTGVSVSADKVVALITTPTELGDVFVAELSTVQSSRRSGQDAGWRRLTDVHAEFTAQVSLAEPEEVWVDSADGTKVQAWLLRPPDFDPGTRYPVILYIHGGPHQQYGNTVFHELQWHAARGYVVMYGNPRGSANLGEDYMAHIRNAWGVDDYVDLMAIADYGAKLPYVDPDRAGVCGGSYGGYMTSWTIGHTNRFRCAIADRSVVDMVSQWGQTDDPIGPNGYWKGNTWDDTETLRQHSPVTYAANCTTPVLLIHSEGDWRCPIGQSQEFFTALKRLRKCPVELVWYPPETSHGMSRGGPPDLRQDRLARYAEWFDRYLKYSLGTE